MFGVFSGLIVKYVQLRQSKIRISNKLFLSIAKVSFAFDVRSIFICSERWLLNKLYSV